MVLSDVPLEISGLFKCVVSAETTFETLAAQDQLTVVGESYLFLLASFIIHWMKGKWNV